MAKSDFIPHALGGHQGYGELMTMIVPEGTVLLRRVKVTGGAAGGVRVRAVPYKTRRDIQVTIRGHFLEEADWSELEE